MSEGFTFVRVGRLKELCRVRLLEDMFDFAGAKN